MMRGDGGRTGSDCVPGVTGVVGGARGLDGDAAAGAVTVIEIGCLDIL